MVMASTIGGIFMYVVHVAAKQMPKEEYGIFATLLQVVLLMAVPGIGLQTVFAQQAAAAATEADQRELAAAFRGIIFAIFLLWLVVASFIFAFRHQFAIE